jgi:tetratricopeptide (TPR) repeat protein
LVVIPDSKKLLPATALAQTILPLAQTILVLAGTIVAPAQTILVLAGTIVAPALTIAGLASAASDATALAQGANGNSALTQRANDNPAITPEVVALARQGEAALKANQASKAARLFSQYRQTHRCGEDFYAAVADVYRGCYLDKLGHEYLTMGLRQFPNSFALHLREAQYWIVVNELDMAEPHIRLCLKVQPKSGAARALLAKMYNERMDFANGLKEIDAAIAEGPVDGNMWFTRANSLNNLGRMEEAVTCLDKAVVASNHADFNYRKMRALLLIRLGRHDLALKDALYLAAADPSHAATFYDKAGACYLALKQPKQAVKYYDLAIKGNHDNIGSHRGRLAALEALKDTKAAEQERNQLKQLEEEFSPGK